MAARGLVNGRGPRRRRGRDSAKRVVQDTIPLIPLLLLFGFYLTNVFCRADAVILLEGGREVRLR